MWGQRELQEMFVRLSEFEMRAGLPDTRTGSKVLGLVRALRAAIEALVKVRGWR